MIRILLFLSLYLLTGIVQKPKEPAYPIPDEINKIFAVYCVSCHGTGVGKLAHSKLNYLRWEMYGASKEKVKAAEICASMSKGSMPPKSWRELNPGMKPTKEEIEIICNWSESLKSEKNINQGHSR